MRGQVSLDLLITWAAVSALLVILLTPFKDIFTRTEQALRRAHLSYLARVIEDRMEICPYVDNVKIYAPYVVTIDCFNGRICSNNVCVEVNCVGGGEGKEFVVEKCTLKPVSD